MRWDYFEELALLAFLTILMVTFAAEALVESAAIDVPVKLELWEKTIRWPPPRALKSERIVSIILPI